MSDKQSYRFPAPSGAVVELTTRQYELLVDKNKGGLTPHMLHRLARAAELLAVLDEHDGRTLRQLVASIHGEPDAVPINMERRAMVALVTAGLANLTGKAGQARYTLVGGAA